MSVSEAADAIIKEMINIGQSIFFFRTNLSWLFLLIAKYNIR